MQKAVELNRGWRSVKCSTRRLALARHAHRLSRFRWAGQIRFANLRSYPNDRSLLHNRWPSSLESEGDNSAYNRYANQNVDHPINSTIQGGVIGWLDSGHLKPGQSISVTVYRAGSHRAALLPRSYPLRVGACS
jgi:hypothetical protein